MVYFTKESDLYHFNELISILRKLDTYFSPSMSSRVDLNEFARKLDKFGNLEFACTENDGVIGIIAYYCNDHATGSAYGTYLGVLKEYQGKGIASELMKRCLETCRKSGMKEMILTTEASNMVAKNFHEKFGFDTEKSTTVSGIDKYVMKIKL